MLTNNKCNALQYKAPVPHYKKCYTHLQTLQNCDMTSLGGGGQLFCSTRKWGGGGERELKSSSNHAPEFTLKGKF